MELSVSLTADAVSAYDAVIVTTDHTAVDYALIAGAAKMLFDSRNVFAALGVPVAEGRFVKV